MAELQFGTGAAGWLGRHIARNMGLPHDAGRIPLEVTISHTRDELVWARRFGTHAPMVSRFAPVGQWPHGHFRERTGALQFELTVDTLRTLAKHPGVIKSKACKELRTAVYDFRQACNTGVNAAGWSSLPCRMD